MCLIKIECFCTKNEDFDQIHLNTGSKTQNLKELSLDLIKSGKILKVLIEKISS